MFCFVFIASAELAPAAKGLNENGQLPVVDALADQTEGKCCLSYRINSIFSGSCLQNNSYSISPAVFYFAFDCMPCSPVDLLAIVSISLLFERKGDTMSTKRNVCIWRVCEELVTCTHPSVVFLATKDISQLFTNTLGFVCVSL